MAQRPPQSQSSSPSGVMDISEAVAIARLRMMIARSEARKARRDFADAILRLELGAADAALQNRVLTPASA